MSVTEIKAGPELDAEIARRVFGWNEVEPGVWLCPIDDPFHVWNVGVSDYPVEEYEVASYSLDIRWAWLVVEKMRELGWRWTIDIFHDGSVGVDLYASDTDEYARGSNSGGEAYEPTPLAICRAALAALESC